MFEDKSITGKELLLLMSFSQKSILERNNSFQEYLSHLTTQRSKNILYDLNNNTTSAETEFVSRV